MENIEIKKICQNNVEMLQQISIKTFSETFSGNNNQDDMAKYLDNAFSIVKLTAELNDPSSHFYFASENGHVIGYLKLNSGNSQTELRDKDSIEIERIYVLQAYHGKRVGQLLYEKAIQLSRELNASYIWLGVWEENPRAIKFYQKNGFVEFDKHIFKLGDDDQTDIMMKKTLK